MKTSNPALNEQAFKQRHGYAAQAPGQTMTIQGAVNKTLFLLFLLVAAAVWVWGKVVQPNPIFDSGESASRSMSAVMPWMVVGGIGGFITALVTIFKKEWSPVTAPIYAVLEGLVIGGLSGIFEIQYPGIVVQAVALTFGTLLCLLLAYQSGMVRATENFKLGIVAATGAIALVYLVGWIMSFFHAQIPLINGSGPVGIIFSLVVVTIAAFNLVLDFDLIEQGASLSVPKYMEWYSAFALMVTLIWLYMEILRLLAKLRDRR